MGINLLFAYNVSCLIVTGLLSSCDVRITKVKRNITAGLAFSSSHSSLSLFKVIQLMYGVTKYKFGIMIVYCCLDCVDY